MNLEFRGGGLDLGTPRVMGILNITRDSFSDGGRYFSVAAAIDRAGEMLQAGADILDIGGESTRPGAEPVPESEELERVVPVIEELRRQFDCLISIDSMKPAVMKAACLAGAGMINDVNALQAPGALDIAKNTGAAVCLMHMQGQPGNMQKDPDYRDVVGEVMDFLLRRAAECRSAGIAQASIVLDPGFGFGKRLEHNLALLGALHRYCEQGYPVLVGLSRKSMFGEICERGVDERLSGSLAAAAIAVQAGASIVRTHDVAETLDAVRVAARVRNYVHVANRQVQTLST